MLPVKKTVTTATAMKSQPPAPTGQQKVNNFARTAKNLGIGVLTIGATYFVVRKIVKGIKKNRSETKFTKAAQQAVALRSAMNRSGMNWLHWIDGTDVDSLYNLANQIADIKKVAKEYKNLYGRVLAEDLRKELKTDELAKFNTLLNKTAFENIRPPKKNTKTPILQAANNSTKKLILTEKKVRVYKSLTWLPFGTIKKIKAKSYIPFGVRRVVEKRISALQKLKFYEVLVRTVENKVHTVFVETDGSTLIPFESLSHYASDYSPATFTNKDFD